MSLILKKIKVFASIKFTIICLFTLSILSVLGTLYQVDHGVYAAQKRIFNSWLFFISGILPFPGLKTVSVFLTINLVASGLRVFSLKINKIGILFMHLGAAILIAGAALSSFMVHESVLSLAEGEKTSVALKQNQWELAIGKKDRGKISNVGSYPFSALQKRQVLQLPGLQAAITINQIFENCVAYGATPHRIDSLQSVPNKNSGESYPGLIANVKGGNGAEYNLKIVIYSGAMAPSMCVLGSDTLLVLLQPVQIKLPVQMELVKFTKVDHPGTEIAKSYSSHVKISNSQINRDAVISMNRPFRYKDFTFYQTGFSQQNGYAFTSISVVQNPVKVVPYIAGALIIIGAFIHFSLKFWKACVEVQRQTKAGLP